MYVCMYVCMCVLMSRNGIESQGFKQFGLRVPELTTSLPIYTYTHIPIHTYIYMYMYIYMYEIQ